MAISMLCAVLFFIALVWWLHPRLTTHLDRRLTVPRLAQPLLIHPRNTRREPIAATAPQLFTSVEMVEQLIRLTRSGVHARDALVEVFAQHTLLSSHFASTTLTHTMSIPEILLACAQICESAQQHDDAHMYRMVKASFVHGVFVPSALEQVLTTLRTRHAIRAEIRTASAQAMFTVRILTYLPIVGFVIVVLSSPDMRGRFFHLSTLVVLALGLFLNRLGAKWIHTVIAHTMHRPVDETVALSEQLAASLRAGCSLTESLHSWEGLSVAGSAVAQAMMRGERIESALHHLPHTTAGYRLAHTIQSAHKDGLPLMDTVHRLTSDTHNDMRSATETLIRQLPGRLTAPVVLCILPSFLIIAVVPLIIHSLGQLGPALSPALSSTP